MDRCRMPLFLSPALVDAAVALAGRNACLDDVSVFAHCELAEHLDDEHAAHLLFAEEPSGRAAWVVWCERQSRVQLKDPCTERDSGGEICLLFTDHPEAHQWPDETNSLMPLRD